MEVAAELYRVNPLTPVPAITSHDEPRPFFHFWRHPFWPKLVSSILNLCRRKHRSNDAQIRVTGRMEPEMCTKMLKTDVEWKTRSKISCHYTWLLDRKNCPSRWRFLRSFLTKSKPCGRSIAAANIKEKEEKKRWKNQKSKSLRT